jgi:hypothetical protein
VWVPRWLAGRRDAADDKPSVEYVGTTAGDTKPEAQVPPGASSTGAADDDDSGRQHRKTISTAELATGFGLVVGVAAISKQSPSLADKVALRTADYTIDEIAEEITAVIQSHEVES